MYRPATKPTPAVKHVLERLPQRTRLRARTLIKFTADHLTNGKGKTTPVADFSQAVTGWDLGVPLTRAEGSITRNSSSPVTDSSPSLTAPPASKLSLHSIFPGACGFGKQPPVVHSTTKTCGCEPQPNQNTYEGESHGAEE